MIYYFSAKYFPAHKKQVALRKIYNFVQIEEESLPQAWGRLLRLLNALPDHPVKKKETSKRKKKKNDRTLHTSSEPVVDTRENPNDISIFDAETQSDNEHEP